MDCVVEEMSGQGVCVRPDRQRFYCEALRCLSNGAEGIEIQGNDAVIGPRSGFGNNGATSIFLSDCSAAIVTGVNCWESSNRQTGNLALVIQNMNGCVVSGSKFNDTISIETGSETGNYANAIVISGNEFQPNSGVFDPSSGHPKNTNYMGSYDAFVRVQGMANVHVAANNFSANITIVDMVQVYRTFSYIISVVTDGAVGDFSGTGQVVFTGAVLSGASATLGNYLMQPILLGDPTTTPPLSPGRISYSIRDLTTGAATSHSEGYDSVTGGFQSPDMRGVDAMYITDAAYANYSVVDGGPALQISQPELLEGSSGVEAAQFYSFTNVSYTTPILVPASTRYLVLENTDTSALTPTITIALQPAEVAANAFPLTIEFRGLKFDSLAWTYQTSLPVPLGANDPPLPLFVGGTVASRTKLEFLYRASPATYYNIT